MEFTELKKELINNRKMETDGQIELFEQSLNTIFSRHDFNDIDNLICGFDDQTENEGVMFSLIHAIEYFVKQKGTQEYVCKILSCLKLMSPHASNWADILILRIINNDDCYTSLQKNVIANNSYDINIFKSILNRLITRNPKQFSEKCNHILSLMPE